jgi:inosine triphosphate pyrophosphatase
MSKLIFVTGNVNKVIEARQILFNYDIEHMNIDIPEIQGNAEDIVKEKARFACESFGKPVFVEDVSLHFDALNGLPGPYIKEFMQKMKLEDIPKLIEPFSDRKATAVCSIGYCEPTRKPVCLQGEVKGMIVKPRGESNFSWDPIFEPDGYNMTFAEMTAEDKNRISHRRLALEKFKEYLEGLSRAR